MADTNRSRSLAVCLISPHPGLLVSMQRILSRPGFRVKTLRLASGPGHELKRLRLPPAVVYVLDATSSRPVTQTLIEMIRERFPRARTVVVKETLQDANVFEYLRVGARGTVRFVDARRELARAVRAVAEGGFWVRRAQLARFVDSILFNTVHHASLDEPGHLSRREREVLLAILEGLANKEISTKLHISERTVKFHVSKVLAKFGAQRRSDLIRRHYQLWPLAS